MRIQLAMSLLVLLAETREVSATEADQQQLTGEHRISSKLSIELSPPVLIARSAPGGVRWGVHQFPALNRLPDGSILIMYADARDMFETHGGDAPAFVSRDEGDSWQPHTGDLHVTRPHFSVSEVFDGEYFASHTQPYFNFREAGITLPEPISVTKVYGKRLNYALEDFPSQVQEDFATVNVQRYTPKTKQWRQVTAGYDNKNRILFRHGGSDLLPQTCFERPLLKHRGELLYAEYRAQYLADGRTTVRKGISSCMVSRDNGKSFQRRATIAVDPTGKNLKGEPWLAETADGNLICAIRQTDHEQKPMQLTWSNDGGRTWDEPEDLYEFGVWPCVSLIGKKTLALSYGRPGVWLSFALDGIGKSWTKPFPLIVGDENELGSHSCGYTSQLPLDDSSFLLAYSDFDYTHPEGGPCKAILVRRVTLHYASSNAGGP